MRWMIVAVAMMAPACAGAPMPASPHQLDGRWIVDLSSKPGEPYAKVMELSLSGDGAVTGAFYDSELLAGRWKTDRGRTCVSFRNTDGAGPYHTSACLVGAGVQGQTWAEHRNFLFNWDAVREQQQGR